MKYLHNERDLFEKIILETSEKKGIVPVIIEKDYYVTLILMEIVKIQPNIIFRGGTSLSKCYHIINRFSEDIDLNIECEGKATEGERKKLVANVKKVIDCFDFILTNSQDIHSRRDFNRFEIDVNSIFSSKFIKHDLIVETAVFFRSYPCTVKPVCSYVYEYLKFAKRDDLIELFCLQPFELKVQTLERTFIDKLFAICDYFIAGRTDEHSRHIYDLFKISEVITIDENMVELFRCVRRERQKHRNCYSAQEDFDVGKCLNEIISRDVYKKDYESVTSSLIFDDVSYEEVKESLIKIVCSRLLK